MRMWILSVTLLVAAGCRDDAPVAGRLDFLRSHDTTRAYAIDSAYDPEEEFGILDPPYDSGLNLLTVLRDVDRPDIDVQETLPLGEHGYLTCVELSPDGDTAIVTRADPSEILVIRGLAAGSPYLDHALAVDEGDPTVRPSTVAFGPDGSWALVGIISFGPPLKLYVIGGLPQQAFVAGEIDLGPEEKIDCGNVGRVRVNDSGTHAIVQSGWGRVHSAIADEYTLRIIRDPGPGGAHVTTSVLQLPLDPVIPPEPELEGLNVGDPGVFEVLCDTDSIVLPMSGNLAMGAPDQRILLIRGIRRDRLEIARILGPDDGVPITPLKAVRLPDCDRMVISTMWSRKLCILSGLSDPTFQSVAIEAFDAPSPMLCPALTADGRTLVVLTARGPFDNRPPARVYNFDVGAEITGIGGPLYGPVRAPPSLISRLVATPPPGLSDYVRTCTRNLPPEINRSLQTRIDLAVEHADRGRDESAREELQEFRTEVHTLVEQGLLRPAESPIMDTLVDVAQARLERR